MERMMNLLGMRGEVGSMDEMGMDLDPEYAMAVIESMQGDNPEDKLVDTNFYDEFDDDLDDDDLE